MSTLTCAEVRQAITATFTSESPSHVAPAVSDHVAHCALCRGALHLLITTVLQASCDPVTMMDCCQCQDALAAFIDRECEEGSTVAARTYPHVWWHLWTCPLCAETYNLTLRLLDAERNYELLPITSMLRQASPYPATHSRRHPQSLPTGSPMPTHIRLPHALLAQTVNSRTLLGHAYGEHDDDTVISEEQHAGYTFNMSLNKGAEATWQFQIVVTPPVNGTVTLTFHDTPLQSRFDAGGRALLWPIPVDLFTSSDSADVMVTVELDIQN